MTRRSSRRAYIEVEVELSEFDDEAVLDYARTLNGGFINSDAANAVQELAHAIQVGDRFTALTMLDRLVRDNSTLRQALETGQRMRTAA